MTLFDEAKVGVKTTKLTMKYARQMDAELTEKVNAIREKYKIDEDDWLVVQVGLMIVTTRQVLGKR